MPPESSDSDLRQPSWRCLLGQQQQVGQPRALLFLDNGSDTSLSSSNDHVDDAIRLPLSYSAKIYSFHHRFPRHRIVFREVGFRDGVPASRDRPGAALLPGHSPITPTSGCSKLVEVTSTRANGKTPAILWLTAALVFFVFEAIAAASVASPYRYSYVSDFISQLGVPAVTPLPAAVMNVGLCVQGVLFLVGAVFAARMSATGHRTLFRVLAALYAVGLVLVAAVPFSGSAGDRLERLSLAGSAAGHLPRECGNRDRIVRRRWIDERAVVPQGISAARRPRNPELPDLQPARSGATPSELETCHQEAQCPVTPARRSPRCSSPTVARSPSG